MKRYTELLEGLSNKLGKYFFPNGVDKFLNYSAAGGIIGSTAGSAVGLLYGVTFYTSKKKTLRHLDRKIQSKRTSAYKRREYIDIKNLIESMSETEYREYVIKKFYTKGTAVGGFVGTTVGTALSRRK